ncbi:hypothetical protein KY289_033482 [Solanum tuberosum]|nr:hypothetical protein KY289_033482 [Solanum tuberosum]
MSSRSGGNLVCQKAPGPGGLGGVIRNHIGDWIIGFYQQRSPCQPNPGKVRALRQGVLMAIEYKLNPIDINTDSMELINMFEHDNHLFTNLIYEYRLLMEKLGAAMPTHIFREKNKVADMLSKEGLKCSTFRDPTFLIVPPMFANSAVWTGISGTMYSRK